MREIDFVIPAYNEEENLLELTTNIIEEFEKINVKNLKIILVENGSEDDSSSIIKTLNKKDERIIGLSLSRNFGPQGAIHAGMCHTNAKYVCIMDGDQQDPPKDAAKMLIKANDEKADVVYAVRVSRKAKFLRKLGYKAFYRVWRYMSEVEVPLDAGEFAVMSNSVVTAILSSQEYHRFNRGLRSWAGFKQIPYKHHRPDRVAGEQKFNIIKDTILGIQAVLSFSLMPIRFIFFLGLFLALISFFIMLTNAIALFLNFLGYSSFLLFLPKGLISLNLISLFFQGVVFIALGVIGEYAGRIYEQTKGRPTFVVKQIIGNLNDK